MKISRNWFLVRLIVMPLFAVIANCVFAQNRPYSLTAPSASTVIEEIVHPYKWQRYQPQYEIPATNFPRDTAEGPVVNYVNAMRHGDYEAALDVWDVTAREFIQRDQKSRQTSREQRLQKVFVGSDNEN